MLVLSAAAAVLFAPRVSPPSMMCAASLVRLDALSLELAETLKVVDDDANEASAKLLTLHDDMLAPLVPPIFDASFTKDDRRAAIEDLSRSLDIVEEVAQGPLLTGRDITSADATLFPVMALCSLTLPNYFGWTEWTDEALFWRRPRLHAWFELFMYERAAKNCEMQLSARLGELDLAALAMDVPTSKLRTFPKHTA